VVVVRARAAASDAGGGIPELKITTRSGICPSGIREFIALIGGAAAWPLAGRAFATFQP
jgi:hypothetical protein